MKTSSMLDVDMVDSYCIFREITHTRPNNTEIDIIYRPRWYIKTIFFSGRCCVWTSHQSFAHRMIYIEVRFDRQFKIDIRYAAVYFVFFFKSYVITLSVYVCVLRFSLCGTIKTGKQKGEQKEDLLYNCLYADSPIELNYFFCYFKITRHDSVFCNDTQTSAAAATTNAKSWIWRKVISVHKASSN